jgi:hypothetical protein
MPLRDHFHPPVSSRHSWEGFHGMWPAAIIIQMNRHLPIEFVAEPRVHVGAEIEIDISTLETTDREFAVSDDANELAAEWTEPSIAVETELLDVGEYEVRVYDIKHDRRLVAAIEIVSPSNKDRPESRRIFVAKCRELLRNGVSVTIVDVVTARNFNLYTDILELIDQTDPAFEPDPPAIYAASCRWIPRGRKHVLETWSHTLRVGEALPTLPLWLAENFYIPLELEVSYEDTCRALRIK